MQLELRTDFSSCFLFVHWMLSDSVWQPSPFITLPKAARIHAQVLCQGVLFQQSEKTEMQTSIIFFPISMRLLLWHTHINSYVQSHTFLLSSDSLHNFPIFFLSYPKVIMLSKMSTVFEIFLAMWHLLSCQFMLFPNFLHEVPSDLAFFLLTLLRLTQSGDRYGYLLYLVLFTCPNTALSCLETVIGFKILQQWCLQPFPWDSWHWQNSVVREAELPVFLAEIWLLLVTSLCATLKSSPLHAGIILSPQYQGDFYSASLLTTTHSLLPFVITSQTTLAVLTQFVASLRIPLLSTICFVVLIVWCLIAAAQSWLHFSGRRGNTVNCELKLHIMLLEMRTSKISRKTSFQMCICAGIVKIGITLCREEEELTDSRDLQSILMFHNCASVCRTAMKLLKSSH